MCRFHSSNKFFDITGLVAQHKRKCLLDTGATRQVISKNLFDEWNLRMYSHTAPRMYSVTGERMNIIGVTKMRVRLTKNGEHKEMEFLVCTDTRNEIIISFKSSIKLKMLPENWPESEIESDESGFQNMNAEKTAKVAEISE